jgi:hypothetical protein
MDAPDSVSFDVRQLASGAGPFLNDQLAALLLDHPDARTVVCDVASLVRPTPADLDHLARLRVVAARTQRVLRLRNVGPQLHLLLMLTGLSELFGSGSEPDWSGGSEGFADAVEGASDGDARSPTPGASGLAELTDSDERAVVPRPHRHRHRHRHLEQREHASGVEVVPDPADPAV